MFDNWPGVQSWRLAVSDQLHAVVSSIFFCVQSDDTNVPPAHGERARFIKILCLDTTLRSSCLHELEIFTNSVLLRITSLCID